MDGVDVVDLVDEVAFLHRLPFEQPSHASPELVVHKVHYVHQVHKVHRKATLDEHASSTAAVHA